MATKVEVISANLNGYGATIADTAVNAGLDVALAAAMVEKESGGRNIFGCDYGDVGDTPPYCRQPVTFQRVQNLRDGGNYTHGMNGIGLTQLTWWSYVEDAESRGGAHIPRIQCEVGFELLAYLISELGYVNGLAAYNAGEGNYQEGIRNGYAHDLAARHTKWQNLLQGSTEVAKVKAADIVAAARQFIGAPYRWWDGEYPFTPGPAMYADATKGMYTPSFVKREGVNCTGLINLARAECGLEPIGGTGHYQDWLENAGTAQPFYGANPGVPGALCVHRYEGGQGLGAEGHIALYTGEHTLLQSEATNGTWEGEDDRDSHSWANYLVYGLMPDVDYSAGSLPTPTPTLPALTFKWLAFDSKGWAKLNGEDCSNGWQDINGTYHARRWTKERGYF